MMILDKIKQRKTKIKKAGHFIAGGVILLHSYERYEHGHSSYLFFLVAGLVFLSVALFHHQLEKKFPRIDILFFLIEATLSFIIAYEYFHAGKTGLPFMYLFAGIMQVITGFIFSKKSASIK